MTRSITKSDFAEVAHLLVLLHELMRAGRDDEGGDALRDQMDAYWLRLTDEEKELLRGLSADLKSIGVDRTVREEERNEHDWHLFSNALSCEDWPQVLELLRQVEPGVPTAQVAFLRGACWANLSQPQVAIPFFQEKRRLEPLDAVEEVLLLTCLIEANRLDEAIPRARELAAQDVRPALLLKAAEVLFLEAGQLQGDEAETRLRNAIEVARRGLQLGESDETDELFESMRLAAYLHVALSYDQLGQRDEAVRCCERALSVDPEHFDARMLHAYLTDGALPHSEQHRRLATKPNTVSLFANSGSLKLAVGN